MASMGEDGEPGVAGRRRREVHRRGRAKQGGLTSAESRRTAREAQSQPGVGENRPPERPSVVGSQSRGGMESVRRRGPERWSVNPRSFQRVVGSQPQRGAESRPVGPPGAPWWKEPASAPSVVGEVRPGGLAHRRRVRRPPPGWEKVKTNG